MLNRLSQPGAPVIILKVRKRKIMSSEFPDSCFLNYEEPEKEGSAANTFNKNTKFTPEAHSGECTGTITSSNSAERIK